jgi:hypothetical protein
MYIIQNGKIVHLQPSIPQDNVKCATQLHQLEQEYKFKQMEQMQQIRELELKCNSPNKILNTHVLKQILFVLFVVFLFYIFTCTECKEIFNKLRA